MVCEPLELEYIAAGVPGHEVRIHDLLVDHGLEKALRDFDPDIVGTSCYINNVPEALSVCRTAKRVNPFIKTVVGGAHATRNPRDFECAQVDVIVQGEGISTFREIVSCLEQQAPPFTVPGIGYKQPGGLYLYTGERPFPRDVDAFPLPARSLTARYREEYFFQNWRPLTLMKTAWGCPYRCRFCYSRGLTGDGYFARSPASVLTELKTIASEEIFIVDDTFLYGKRRLERLAGLIEQEKLKKKFLVHGRTDFICENKELLERWRRIGLTTVQLGLEATTNEELAAYDKRHTVADNDRAIEICDELDLDVSASFILSPDTTRERFQKLREYIVEKGLLTFTLHPLTPLPGTELYRDYQDRLALPHQKAHAQWDFQHCVIKPKHLTLRAFYQQMNWIYLSAMANPLQLRRARRHRRAHPSLFSKEGFAFYRSLLKTALTMLSALRGHPRLPTPRQEPP